ncbi:MAG: carboxypeptidase-like regulatory domain-containing protein, partial [Thermoflexibacteraceae bacterium]
MKKLLTFLFSVGSLYAHAQTNIKGKVKDTETPLAFATVALLQSKDSSLVKAGYSNDDGTFAFSGVENGSYLVSVTAIGYKKLFSPIIAAKGTEINLGELVAQKETQQLDEVVVTTRKPLVEVQADKTVFNVSSNINAAGTNALEVLRKAPGVTIDNNNRISVQGKNSVTVYIDGRQTVFTTAQLAEYLKTMQASDIESIEIITQPSAKYDAAGNAGIINIKLKKNTNLGTNGSLNLGYGHGMFFGKFNGSLALNHRSKKMNYFANYSNGTSTNWSDMFFYRKQNGQTFSQPSTNIADESSHNLRAGADYTIDKKNSIGFVISGVSNTNDNRGDSRNTISDERTGQINQILISKSTTDMKFKNLSGNLNYRYADTSGRELNFDANIMR